MKHLHHKHLISHISRRSFTRTVIAAVVLCITIVATSAALARAAHNFKIALREKPDIAIYLLLPDEQITTTKVLREGEKERDYLAETKDGPKLVKLKKDNDQWYAALIEPLHGDETIPADIKEETQRRQ